MEEKRGMDATDPRPQLLGAILAVLWAKIAHAGDAAPAEAFGCFTVGDIWTFVRAEAVVRAAGTVPRGVGRLRDRLEGLEITATAVGQHDAVLQRGQGHRLATAVGGADGAELLRLDDVFIGE